jgi:hypothetical protein
MTVEERQRFRNILSLFNGPQAGLYVAEKAISLRHGGE